MLTLLTAAAVLISGPFVFGKIFDGGPVEKVDFDSLKPPNKPNWFLAAQKDSSVFPMPAGELRERLRAVVLAEPRTRLLASDDNLLQDEFEVRTFYWRFPDRATVRVFELPEGKSTVAIYSRSIYGHSDLGVNRRRVLRWLAVLNRV